MQKHFKVWVKGENKLNDTTDTKHGDLKKKGIPVYFDDHLTGRAVSMERQERHGNKGYMFTTLFDMNGENLPSFNYGSDDVIRDVGVRCDTVKSDEGLFPLRLYLIQQP